mmetsp:Transcript_2626/g.6164  ORF Transcript_2626/g.6164 Transcript_2626/m.6164 type:complete len:359 (-) Transcript_2626:31-1107(-)
MRCAKMADGAFPLLIITGILGFSSALLTRDDLHRPSSGIMSTSQKKRGRSLYVLTEFLDSGVHPTTESGNNFLLGEKDLGKNGRSETKNTLTFQSSFQRQSNALTGLSDDATLDDFFLHHDHLLDAGASVRSKIVPTTPDLLDDWRKACDQVGACPPSADESVIMSVRTAGISIPGLTVEWSALIGTTLVRRRPTTGRGDQYRQQHYPELEFVMIRDENKVSSGAKPIVWIFNKLNRGTSKRKRRQGPMDTTLFTRLGVYKDDDADADADDTDSLVLRCTGTMEMKFRIPSIVTNLVFTSEADSQKAHAERKISNLITRQIEKDTEQNVSRWEENLRSWIASADERSGDKNNNDITTN